MPTLTNRKFTLAARPAAMPSADDFKLVEAPVLSPHPGQFLAKTLYVSVDPYMRGRMRDVKSYAAPVEIGAVMVGGVVSQVIESQHPGYAVGDIVQGNFGWQEYALSDGSGGVRKVDPKIAPISTALGVLGMPGLTAYFGLLDVGQPKAGETVVVSGAAGAVGSIVGQIAKIKGCRAIGTAGSDDKVQWVKELGFDDAFNYKTTTNYVEKFNQLCPRGVDVYFDNVGGKVTDAIIYVLAVHARMAICGQISQYNLEKPELGPRWLWALIVKRARAEGLLVSDFFDRFEPALKEMAGWIREGKLKYREDVFTGFERLPQAFLGLFAGDNTGKRLVKVADPT